MAELKRSGFEVYCIEQEGKWLYEKLPAILTVDRYLIKADGIDRAILTANVTEFTSEIIFYNAMTNTQITTISTSDNSATIEIYATTPGTISIRAGDETKTKYNQIEVVVVES